MSITFYLSLILLLIINCIDRSVTQTPNITLKGGQIIGQQKTIDSKNISVFLGIPYAKPPIGELRFKKPEKIGQWNAPINATNWSKACPQSSGLEYSEDCLYLNIWSPFDTKNISDTQLKAVMFWIHGGSLAIGSSSEFLYHGEVLSTKGDVVVVTINYRLNTFGFFYTGTDDAPGNVGLWDQALALQWVNDNIRYFGGDPNKITIFGESAGSWSVSVLLLSPITQNLFQNAIMMSGAIIGEQSYDSKSVFKAKMLYRAKHIGCNDTGSDFTPKMIECLRKLDVKTLLKINDIYEANTKILVYPLIVIDGTFLTDTPMNLFKTGAYKKNVSLLIGTMEDEASWLLTQLEPTKYSYTSPQNLTYTQATQELKKFLSTTYFRAVINADDVVKVYFNNISKTSTDYDLLRRTIGIALGDYLLACPTILFAKSVYVNDRNGSKVYEYYFKSKIGAEKYLCSKWMGACHSNDLYPAFGVPFTLYDQSLDGEREESLRVINFFANFAKYGYPSPQNGIEWPKYNTENDLVIKPYFELSSHLNKSVTQFNSQLKVAECDNLLNKYLL